MVAFENRKLSPEGAGGGSPSPSYDVPFSAALTPLFDEMISWLWDNVPADLPIDNLKFSDNFGDSSAWLINYQKERSADDPAAMKAMLAQAMFEERHPERTQPATIWMERVTAILGETMRNALEQHEGDWCFERKLHVIGRLTERTLEFDVIDDGPGFPRDVIDTKLSPWDPKSESATRTTKRGVYETEPESKDAPFIHGYGLLTITNSAALAGGHIRVFTTLPGDGPGEFLQCEIDLLPGEEVRRRTVSEPGIKTGTVVTLIIPLAPASSEPKS